MRHYIPDLILDDCQRMAQLRIDRKVRDFCTVPVHANVLLALIDTYREAREQHLQKSKQE
jgi:hypothetical protein